MKRVVKLCAFIIISISLTSCDVLFHPKVGSGYYFEFRLLNEDFFRGRDFIQSNSNMEESISFISIEQVKKNNYDLNIWFYFKENNVLFSAMNEDMKNNFFVEKLDLYLNDVLLIEIKNEIFEFEFTSVNKYNYFICRNVSPLLNFKMQEKDYDDYPDLFNGKFTMTYSFDDKKTWHTEELELRVGKRKRASISDVIMGV